MVKKPMEIVIQIRLPVGIGENARERVTDALRSALEAVEAAPPDNPSFIGRLKLGKKVIGTYEIKVTMTG
jgi:hypothetical protein